MTKGIREYASQRFNALLPKVGELGPTGFRQAVIRETMAKFSCTVASAATAYNHVLSTARKNTPEAVSGIGRIAKAAAPAAAAPATEKRGPGRPKKVVEAAPAPAAAEPAAAMAASPIRDVVRVVKAKTGEVVAEGIARKLAVDLVDSHTGRGRPRLQIEEPTTVQ